MGGSGPNGLIWCDYFMIYSAITRTEATQTTAFFTAGVDSGHPRHCQNILQLALHTLLEKWFWLKDYAQFHCFDLDLWLANFKICLKILSGWPPFMWSHCNGKQNNIFRAQLLLSNIWNNHFPQIIAFPWIIAPFWCEKRSNRPRLLFEEIW